MIGKIVMIIALVVVVGFALYMLFTKEKLNLAYIKYMLYAYPFMGIDLLPSLFSIHIFDFITIFFLLFLYKRYNVQNATHSIYIILYIIFLLLIFIGVYFSEQITRDTFVALFQLFTITVFIIILYQVLLFEKNAYYEILIGIRFLLIFSFVFLLLQVVIGPGFSFAKSENINVAGGIAIRYPSFFQDPQKYAQFLSVLSFMVLLPAPKGYEFNKKQSILLAVLSICALLLTGGRAGLGGWLVGFIVLVLLGDPINRFRLIIVLSVLGSFVYLFQEQLPIFKRADLESSYIFRQLIWADAMLIHKNHPWFGIGIGNYANYVSLHNPDQFWIHNNEVTFYDHPESGYLKLLVEFGLPAFVVLLFMILYIIYQNIYIYFKVKSIELVLYTAAILSWLIGFYTVYSLGDVRIKLLIAIVVVLSFVLGKSNDLKVPHHTMIHV